MRGGMRLGKSSIGCGCTSTRSLAWLLKRNKHGDEELTGTANPKKNKTTRKHVSVEDGMAEGEMKMGGLKGNKERRCSMKFSCGMSFRRDM
jgi:hypothetical protein